MGDFAVVPSIFDSAVDAAGRQAGYMSGIRSYVAEHTNLGDATGLAMMCLSGLYNSARDNAVAGLADGETVAQAIETKSAETLQAYKDVDEGLGTGFNGIGQEMSDDYETPTMSYGQGGGASSSAVELDPLAAPDPGTPLMDATGGYGRDVASRWAERELGDPFSGSRHSQATAADRTLASWADASGGHPLRDRYEAWLLGDDPNRLPAAPTGADQLRDRWSERTDSWHAGGERAVYNYAGIDAPPATSDWVNNNMTSRTTRAAGDVYGLYNSATGAYGAVQEANTADDRADRMSDLADGPATGRDNVDWAN
ncbi:MULTISPECIES: hypothetical protein [unclassified Pseudactinotalea]|uniref:hypothetical protein n=1 Tax=unclassified Pseudactinotalea TaxID=2649176 RepID=UPI00128CD26B|nr:MULTISPECIES: hypothetical protein [unclassified Pseudactinotalea]MPV49052.1 hypothetical protein [Pseudactinotalea sp. HY160]QGH68270.1 hypothetical protein GCE65_01110 [Pseudactinotalea sp. HY158]